MTPYILALLLGLAGKFILFVIASAIYPGDKLASKYHIPVSAALATAGLNLGTVNDPKIVLYLLTFLGTYIGWLLFKLLRQILKKL